MAAALVGLLAFASCDADRDDNPIMSVPESFNLLKPEMGDNIIDLKKSSRIRSVQGQKRLLTTVSTETSYWIQIAGEDNADFKKKASSLLQPKETLSLITHQPTSLTSALRKVKGWEEESQVVTDKPITLNVRMVGCPKNLNDSANYVYTNVQQVKNLPMFIKESLPQFWYLTGGIIADASWTNDPSKIGISMMPMYVKEVNLTTSLPVMVLFSIQVTSMEFKIIALRV